MVKTVFVSAPIKRPWIANVYKKLEKKCKVVYGKPLGVMPRYNEDELIKYCKEADVVLGFAVDKFTRKVLMECNNLLGIVVANIGYDNVDITAANEAGILVVNSPSKFTRINCAQHTVAMILALAKNIVSSKELLRRGIDRFSEIYDTIYLSEDITVGIIGLGGIGREVVRLLKPFKVTIIYHNRKRLPKKIEKRYGIKYVSLDTLLSSSDFVTIHTPLTRETFNMIGERELRMMKETSYLINISRPEIVDEKALIRVLNEGRIAGAALDGTLEIQPSPNNPLLHAHNVIITPHIAGRSMKSVYDMTDMAVKSCLKILQGCPPSYVINHEILPYWKKRVKMLLEK